MHLKVMALLALGLSACASTPAPRDYPRGPVPVTDDSTGAPAPVTPRAEQGPFQPDTALYACNMTISNRPETGPDRRILNYNPIIVVNGVLLAAAPVNDACMTSGFGFRRTRMHKGIDLQSRPAGPVFAAGPGRILEVSEQTGFGLHVLIDHGRGVYTRYGHMDYFAEGLAPGQMIGFGQPLGMMGSTGNATAVHLHFEVLTGNYDSPKKSWGLEAHNPLDFPAWDGLDAGS